MKKKRLISAVIAAFLTLIPAAPAFAEGQSPEDTAQAVEQTVPVLPADLDFSEPGVTVRTDIMPGYTGIIFTVPKEKYELYRASQAESGRAGLGIVVYFDDYSKDEWDVYGTWTDFTLFGEDGLSGDILEDDCTTDDDFDVMADMTENGDVVGIIYGESDQWVFRVAERSASCLFRYYIMSAGEYVDGGREFSARMLDQDKVRDISALKYTAFPTVTYTGKEFRPELEIYDEGRKYLCEGFDYTVEYSNNKMPGTATVTITGINSYKGTKTLRFRILPRKTALTAKGTAEKRASLSWKKSPGAEGYELQAAEGTKPFAKLSDTAKTSIKAKWTESGGCRFRVRPYVTSGGRRIYGKWSNVAKLN